jgi:addiction module RelE/StbE family toxin
MAVEWSAAALRDVAQHVTYIDQFNPSAANSVARHILDAGNGLRIFSHRGRPGRIAGTRELVAVYPYILVYEIERDQVRILRVWHGAQRRGD